LRLVDGAQGGGETGDQDDRLLPVVAGLGRLFVDEFFVEGGLESIL
jgi:hypothetical protein